jgi:hypothetical protein
MQMIDEKMATITDKFAKSSLPDAPDETKANEVLVEIRQELYKNA